VHRRAGRASDIGGQRGGKRRAAAARGRRGRAAQVIEMAFDVLQTAIERQADGMRLFLPQLIPPVVSPGAQAPRGAAGSPRGIQAGSPALWRPAASKDYKLPEGRSVSGDGSGSSGGRSSSSRSSYSW
jgi:hypothetical protein